jgi:hypothetical protein
LVAKRDKEQRRGENLVEHKKGKGLAADAKDFVKAGAAIAAEVAGDMGVDVEVPNADALGAARDLANAGRDMKNEFGAGGGEQ